MFTNYLEEPDKNYIYKEVLYEVKLSIKYKNGDMMGFEVSEKAKEINERLEAFMDEHIYPRERDYDEFTSDQNNLWQYPDWYEGLKEEAKKQELWNLFLPKEYAPWSPGLTNLEIAGLFETMSRSAWSQQIFNCNAPD